MRRSLVSFWVAALVWSVAGDASAQAIRATVLGTITDRTGAVLPGATAIETALGPEGTRGLSVNGSSLPQLLKNGGYRTGLIGKWYLGGTVTGRKKTAAHARTGSTISSA